MTTGRNSRSNVVVSKYQVQAVSALLRLEKAIRKGELSIDDLEKALLLAIADGWDAIDIALGMASIAVRRSKEQKQKTT